MCVLWDEVCFLIHCIIPNVPVYPPWAGIGEYWPMWPFMVSLLRGCLLLFMLIYRYASCRPSFSYSFHGVNYISISISIMHAHQWWYAATVVVRGWLVIKFRFLVLVSTAFTHHLEGPLTQILVILMYKISSAFTDSWADWLFMSTTLSSFFYPEMTLRSSSALVESALAHWACFVGPNVVNISSTYSIAWHSMLNSQSVHSLLWESRYWPSKAKQVRARIGTIDLQAAQYSVWI